MANEENSYLVDVIGFALIISLAQVYRLRTVLGWNQWTMTASFFTTTLLLGALLCGALGGGRAWLAVLTIGLLGAQQTIGWHGPQADRLNVADQSHRHSGLIAVCISTGSPGARWITVKVISVIPNRSGTSMSSLFIK